MKNKIINESFVKYVPLAATCGYVMGQRYPEVNFLVYFLVVSGLMGTVWVLEKFIFNKSTDD